MWNLRYVNQFLPNSAFIVTSNDCEAVLEAFKPRFRAFGFEMNIAITSTRANCSADLLGGKGVLRVSPRRRWQAVGKGRDHKGGDERLTDAGHG